MTYRVKNITIAVALALVAALLTSFYVTNYQRNVRQDETNVPIWVAKRDIPAGTSGADIERKGMLEKSEIVRRSVVPGAISNPDQVGELVTTQPIFAGEQISTRRFSTPSQRGIKAQLTGVQRAIEIDGGQHNLLAGTLKTGDKVLVRHALARTPAPGWIEAALRLSDAVGHYLTARVEHLQLGKQRAVDRLQRLPAQAYSQRVVIIAARCAPTN